MKKIILFSEIVDEAACEAAEQFIGQGHTVYAMAAKKNTGKVIAGVHYLQGDAWKEQEVKEALGKITEGYLDILVVSVSGHCSGDGRITEYHLYEEILKVLNENVNGAYVTVKESLPLLRRGEGKRIAVITKERGSINSTKEEKDYAYLMSLASINMMQKLFFNALRPEGFTFRNYASEKQQKGMRAADYILGNLCYNERDVYIHSDENRLVMRDAFLKEIPW